MRNNNKGKYNIWKFSINKKDKLNKSYAETLLETQLKFSWFQINSFTITYRTEAHGDIISTNFILHEQEDMGTHSSILPEEIPWTEEPDGVERYLT